MASLTRALDLITVGPLRRKIEARILEAHADDLDDADRHAAAVLLGRAAQLHAWRPA